MKLELNNIKSKNIKWENRIQSLSDLNISKTIDSGYVIAYLYHSIQIGKWTGESFEFKDAFDEKYLISMRIFNQAKEIKIWRQQNVFHARLRIDGEGEQVDCVDAWQVLWGTTKKQISTSPIYTILTEDRGTQLILPFSVPNVDNEKNRLFIHSRHYIQYNKYGQAGYYDSRLLGFTNKKKEELGE